MARYLAVDLGAESGRVIVAMLENGRLTLEETYRFENGAVRIGESLHWDVLHLWDEIKKGLRKAHAENGSALKSLAVDTWGVDFALLDRSGNLVGNPHTYRDPRTAGVMERAVERLSRWEIYRLSGGIQFMSINTLYQMLAMVECKDPRLEIAATFLMIPDLFLYWLTGRKACEYSDATTTQFYNAVTGGWAVDLLDRLGIPSHLFPEVVMPGTPVGTLLPAVAEETGLEGITVVAPAAHDTASAILGVPAGNDRFAWLSSGTWSLMGGNSERPIVTRESMEYNFSSYGGAGGVCLPWKNIMGLWLVQECRRSWALAGEEVSYQALADEAGRARPFVAVINPDDPSFLAPKDMPAAVTAYCQRHGLTVPADRGEMIRSILESLALRYRWTLEKLSVLQDRSFEALHVVGGGTRNRLLCRLTADAIGLPVMAGPVEATAIGNAVIQALAMGDLASLEEARQVVRRSVEVEIYEPGDRAGWDEAYARFLALAG